MDNNKFDSIIFDLDGTLWDATEAISKTWSEILESYPEIDKVVTVDELKGLMGLRLEEIGEKLFPTLNKEMQKKLMLKCCDYEIVYINKNGANLYPDVIETIKYLAENYKLFIVSNCQDGYIESFLNTTNTSKFFKDFECPGRTGLSKGENIKLIIERNNLKSPIYVGDTQGDYDSSKYAEIPFIYAEYGFGKVPDYIYKLSSFSELRKLF